MKLSPLPPLRLTETQAAYIAGFVDGEGSISIIPVTYKKKKTKGLRVCISIVQADPRPIKWMHELLGGNISIRQPSNGLSKLPIWDLRLTDRWAERALPAIIQHMIVKQEKAKMALSVREMINAQRGKNKGLTVEQSEARLRLVKTADNAEQISAHFKESSNGRVR